MKSFYGTKSKEGDHRVSNFAISQRLVFSITSKILRIGMEHIQPKEILHSKLQVYYFCFIEILGILFGGVAEMHSLKDYT